MYKKVIKENLKFGEAMIALDEGKKVTRSVWGGYWQITFIEPIGAVIMATLKGNAGFAPAAPYQVDMMAHDWMIVE